MDAKLLSDVYCYPTMNPQELQRIIKHHEQVRFQKNEFLLKAGQVANAYYIVEHGLVRSYLHDFNGNDITRDFISDGEIANEVSSLFQRIPTRENMQALTEVVAWKIEFCTFQELFLSIPSLTEWGREWMTKQLVKSKDRATEMITDPASIRYARLLKEKPLIFRQAPLKHIASYLGVTDTSLSRIRKEFALAR